MEATPLVSVIMPSFNSAETISQSIESVLAQIYQNWELLITDDHSSDDTFLVAKQYAEKDARIQVFCLKENGGAGKARNYSIEKAKGRFIAFLDSDDLWVSEKLSKQIPFMLENSLALSYSAYQKFDRSGDQGVIVPPESVSYKKLLYGNVIGCLTAIYDQEMLGKRFMPTIRKRQDMALWLDILKDIDLARGLTVSLAKYRTDTGMTVNKWKVLGYQWELYREVLRLSFLSSAKYFICYAVNGFLKSKK